MVLSGADAGAAERPVLRTAVGGAGVLAAEAEQAVLPGRQVEAWQGGRVDLLLREVRRQLLIQGHEGGERSARCVGVGTRAAANVVVAGANDAVVEVGLGADVDRARRLNHRRVGLVTGGQLRGAGVLGDCGFRDADEAGNRGFQTTEVVGVVVGALVPVLIGQCCCCAVPTAGVVGALAAICQVVFSVAGFHAAVGQTVEHRGQGAAGGDVAASCYGPSRLGGEA